MNKKYKQIFSDLENKVSKEIKMLLHAGRDCMRNQKKDSKTVAWDINNPYYCEAFGIMRGLALLGYGTINGPINIDSYGNLRYWFCNLEKEVLAEENFEGSGDCDYCFERYGKDDVRNRLKQNV